jgi:hypothetical protein
MHYGGVAFAMIDADSNRRSLHAKRGRETGARCVLGELIPLGWRACAGRLWRVNNREEEGY